MNRLPAADKAAGVAGDMEEPGEFTGVEARLPPVAVAGGDNAADVVAVTDSVAGLGCSA